MDKLAYLLIALKEGRYKERGWLLATFGILADNYTLDSVGVKVTDGKLFLRTETGYVEISDFKLGEPLFKINDRISLKASSLACIKEDIVTTYGILIVNAIVIEYPYDGLVSFIQGPINGKTLNKVAEIALKDPNTTIEMHHKFENAVVALMMLSPICITSATRRSITPNKESAILKERLLKEHPDYESDPRIIADIQDKLIDLDKEYLANDLSSGFFIGRKSKISRLKMTGMIGAEADFIDESKINTITRSLNEGWIIEDIPKLVNASRGGSYNRGANTALGGSKVKEIARVFQTYNIVTEICTTKRGVKILLDDNNYKNYVGRYLLGKMEPLEISDLETMKNKVIEIRSPMYCISPNAGFCIHCLGKTVVSSGIKINVLMTTCAARFLSIFMSMMHGTIISYHRYNYKDRIS